jgi:hypothetical protein
MMLDRQIEDAVLREKGQSEMIWCLRLARWIIVTLRRMGTR